MIINREQENIDRNKKQTFASEIKKKKSQAQQQKQQQQQQKGRRGCYGTQLILQIMQKTLGKLLRTDCSAYGSSRERKHHIKMN